MQTDGSEKLKPDKQSREVKYATLITIQVWSLKKYHISIRPKLDSVIWYPTMCPAEVSLIRDESICPKK